ncbi:hypothetical protein ITP53_21250 [Nonomuraea sp. K274]|uniref:Hydantoinase/oxoprolinase-like protein n=1 Tax=Nonomuraea cypriaca TaxID=1187855 RepID=A0A931F1J4_9ACTN|nr:hypothetical protein [Nonomuraea cypriaca]MBF8188211.1 hypothetical protein [Nonomuraea cypriaca]
MGRPLPVVVAVRDGVPDWPVNRATARTAARACVAVDLSGSGTSPVAAIRVGGPCPAALRPHVARPGAATIVRGGHSLTGRPLEPLDTEAVRRFAGSCGLADFAVTASGSPMLSDHELAVAEIVAAEVPGARITLSYEFGQPGLRERERDTIRNAALGGEAGRIADEVVRELPRMPAYFARSDGGVVSAHYFRRFPLACDLGATASRVRGRAALADESVPGEVAAAYGAAIGRPEARVERIVQAHGRAELERALQDARDEVLTRVVSAGAAPGSAWIAETTVNPLSYLPHGIYRVRVAAEGVLP